MKTTLRRTAFGLVAAGATLGVLGLPIASAAPGDPAEPTPTPAAPAAPAATAAADDCTAAGLAKTISSVTADLNVYFAAHPDVNVALIDAARQSGFTAVGQFNDYFNNHPEEADQIRVIQAPLGAYKDRCGLGVAPTDALAVLADV